MYLKNKDIGKSEIRRFRGGVKYIYIYSSGIKKERWDPMTVGGNLLEVGTHPEPSNSMP